MNYLSVHIPDYNYFEDIENFNNVDNDELLNELDSDEDEDDVQLNERDLPLFSIFDDDEDDDEFDNNIWERNYQRTQENINILLRRL